MAEFDNQAQEALLARLKRRGKRGLKLPQPDRAATPDTLERQYARDLNPLVQAIREVLAEIVKPGFPRILESARLDLPVRSDAYQDEIEALFSRARIAFASRYTIQEARSLARKYAQSGSEWNERQIRKQFLKVLGLQPVLNEPYLGPLQDEFVKENVDLITSIPADAFDKIEQKVRNAVSSGRLSTDLAAELEDEFGDDIAEVTENVKARARLIARDQIAKLNSDLNRSRMQNLGIAKYKWRTSKDERVRATHRALEGKVFAWTDPPNINGKRLHPGQDYQCRCTAEPVFESNDILKGTNLGELLT